MSNNRRWKDKLRLWLLLHPDLKLEENARLLCQNYCPLHDAKFGCLHLSKMRVSTKTGDIFFYKIPQYGTPPISSKCVEFLRH